MCGREMISDRINPSPKWRVYVRRGPINSHARQFDTEDQARAFANLMRMDYPTAQIIILTPGGELEIVPLTRRRAGPRLPSDRRPALTWGTVAGIQGAVIILPRALNLGPGCLSLVRTTTLDLKMDERLKHELSLLAWADQQESLAGVQSQFEALSTAYPHKSPVELWLTAIIDTKEGVSPWL
jgi:hypothetical protein